MKSAPVITALFATALCAVCTIAAAQSSAPAANDNAASAKLKRVAYTWQQGKVYKFRDLVNLEGYVFQAGTGSAHKRPNPAADDGWEKLNACDDKSEGAIACVDAPAAPAAAEAPAK